MIIIPPWCLRSLLTPHIKVLYDVPVGVALFIFAQLWLEQPDTSLQHFSVIEWQMCYDKKDRMANECRCFFNTDLCLFGWLQINVANSDASSALNAQCVTESLLTACSDWFANGNEIDACRQTRIDWFHIRLLKRFVVVLFYLCLDLHLSTKLFFSLHCSQVYLFSSE